MVRFGVSDVAVVGLALAAALSSTFWLNEMGGGHGAVQAAERPVLTAPARLVRQSDGHWWATGLVHGRRVRLMVDTGAGLVALTPDDARRLGVLPAQFDQEIRTAAGPARAARVTLRSLSVAGVVVRDVDALVVEQGLPHSLLGMSWLGRLSGFEARSETLTLRP